MASVSEPNAPTTRKQVRVLGGSHPLYQVCLYFSPLPCLSAGGKRLLSESLPEPVRSSVIIGFCTSNTWGLLRTLHGNLTLLDATHGIQEATGYEPNCSCLPSHIAWCALLFFLQHSFSFCLHVACDATANLTLKNEGLYLPCSTSSCAICCHDLLHMSNLSGSNQFSMAFYHNLTCGG